MSLDNGDSCISCGEKQMTPWRGLAETARACLNCGFCEFRQFETTAFDPAKPVKYKEIAPYKPLGEPKHPHAIKYVAKVFGITGPKGIQAFGSDRSILRDWAKKILAVQGTKVIIFEYTEVICDIIEPEIEPEGDQECDKLIRTKTSQMTLES